MLVILQRFMVPRSEIAMKLIIMRRIYDTMNLGAPKTKNGSDHVERYSYLWSAPEILLLQ